MGGRNASTYKLFKKSTSYSLYNVWRSPVYQIGKNFDVISIKFSVFPTIDDGNARLFPVLYFDNGSSTSAATEINNSYTGNLITLTAKSFGNSVHGRNNFFLEIQMFHDLIAIKLPITIEYEVQDV